jgi:lysophospholipase L1-like esterase
MRRLYLLLASSLVALFVAEMCLRHWFPVGGTIYTLHPQLLHATRPNSRRIQPMPDSAGGARSLIVINSTGYRGPELEESGRPRVAVYGDSLVMGENVAQADTFVSRLAGQWEGIAEVVNAGASGYGPGQICLRVEAELESLQPDLIVLVLCATNDLGDLLRNKLFRLEQGQLVRGHPIVHESVRAKFEEALEASSRLALLRALDHAQDDGIEEQAAIPGAASGLIPEYLEQAAWEFREGVQKGGEVVYSLLKDVYDADLAVHPQSAMAQYKRELLAAILTRLTQVCEAGGVPLVCVVVPSPVDLDPDFRIRVDRSLFPNYDPRGLTNACADAARSAGIEVRDLYDLFAANDPSQIFVGAEDIHWNEQGMALAAKDVARWLTGLEAGAVLSR